MTPDILPYRAFFCLCPARPLGRPESSLQKLRCVYLHTTVAFLKVASAVAARDACFAATEKWPHNQLALLGLGNTELSLQDWQTAETAFRKLAGRAADPMPVLNNLALTLDAQGRLAQALEVARRAVSLDGPFAAESRNTLVRMVEKVGGADEQNR